MFSQLLNVYYINAQMKMYLDFQVFINLYIFFN